MNFRNLFVSRTPAPPRMTGLSLGPADQGAPPPPPPNEGGAFITPQTLASFAGASTIIGVTTRVVTALLPNVDGQSVAAIAAVIMGVVIFLINVTDPDAKPSNMRGWFIAFIVGLVNTIYLVAIAIGVFEAIAGTDG
jgi:hypothetical protein